MKYPSGLTTYNLQLTFMAPKKKTTPAVSTFKSLTDLKAMNKTELTTELATARKDFYVLTMKKEL